MKYKYKENTNKNTKKIQSRPAHKINNCWANSQGKYKAALLGGRNAHKFWFVTVCEKIAPDFGLRLFHLFQMVLVFLLLQNLSIILIQSFI